MGMFKNNNIHHCCFISLNPHGFCKATAKHLVLFIKVLVKACVGLFTIAAFDFTSPSVRDSCTGAADCTEQLNALGLIHSPPFNPSGGPCSRAPFI